MSMSDPGADEIRNTGAYRAAVWSVRLGYLCGLVWIGMVWSGYLRGSMMFLTFLLLLPLWVSTNVFLRRAGVRYGRRGLSPQIARDVRRQFNRDVLWLPRR